MWGFFKSFSEIFEASQIVGGGGGNLFQGGVDEGFGVYKYVKDPPIYGLSRMYDLVQIASER